MTQDKNILPYTPIFIKLLKGPIEYLERTAWEQLLQYQGELTRFLQQLGLQLVLEKEDGYAYLEQVLARGGSIYVRHGESADLELLRPS